MIVVNALDNSGWTVPRFRWLTTMQLVDNDAFLKKLNTAFESTKEKGSVWLTHKRYSYEGGDVEMQARDGGESTNEYPCLLRLTDGNDLKVSTLIEPAQLMKFHAAYGALLRASLTTLRKRDKKREKIRSELAAKRKKRMVEPVLVDGPKRGKGRRQRQRKIKALTKQQESQQKFKDRVGLVS